MNRKLETAVKRWLRAESVGDAPEAERRLAAAFRARRAEMPASGFTARVMTRLEARAGAIPDWTRAARPLAPICDWCFKIGVAVSLLLAGAAAVVLGGMASTFARRGGGEQALDWGIALLAAASERVARSLALWDGIERGSSVLASAVLSPESLAAVAAGLIVSSIAFRGLARLVVFERSANHV